MEDGSFASGGLGKEISEMDECFGFALGLVGRQLQTVVVADDLDEFRDIRVAQKSGRWRIGGIHCWQSKSACVRFKIAFSNASLASREMG